ncbi:MAG TPA: cysteine peptidase family C39 domain-containing protein, partial [Kofleriaceae bacterium]
KRLALVIALAACSACTHLAYTGGAKPLEPVALDASWVHAAPTPVVLQKQETDCGLAALAMVAGAWGQTWDPAELARKMPPGDKGVKLATLRDYARSRGFDAFAVAGSSKDLQHELAAGRPVLLGLMLPFDRKSNQSHYEVAIAIRPSDGTVITIDPASGKWMTRKRQVLDVEWKAANYASLVITGEKAQAAGL